MDVLGDCVRVMDGLDLVGHVDHHVIAENFIGIIFRNRKRKTNDEFKDEAHDLTRFNGILTCVKIY